MCAAATSARERFESAVRAARPCCGAVHRTDALFKHDAAAWEVCPTERGSDGTGNIFFMCRLPQRASDISLANARARWLQCGRVTADEAARTWACCWNWLLLHVSLPRLPPPHRYRRDAPLHLVLSGGLRIGILGGGAGLGNGALNHALARRFFSAARIPARVAVLRAQYVALRAALPEPAAACVMRHVVQCDDWMLVREDESGEPWTFDLPLMLGPGFDDGSGHFGYPDIPRDLYHHWLMMTVCPIDALLVNAPLPSTEGALPAVAFDAASFSVAVHWNYTCAIADGPRAALAAVPRDDVAIVPGLERLDVNSDVTRRSVLPDVGMWREYDVDLARYSSTLSMASHVLLRFARAEVIATRLSVFVRDGNNDDVALCRDVPVTRDDACFPGWFIAALRGTDTAASRPLMPALRYPGRYRVCDALVFGRGFFVRVRLSEAPSSSSSPPTSGHAFDNCEAFLWTFECMRTATNATLSSGVTWIPLLRD